MKKFKAMPSVPGILVLLAASVVIYAQDSPPQPPLQGDGPGFGMHRPPLEQALGQRGAHGQWWNDTATAEKLNLSEDQRKSMDAIMLQHRETLIDLRANVEKAELAMQPLMQQDQPNESQVLAQIDKVAQARAELEKANARFLLEIRSKLTPEQWKQLQTLHSEREGRRDWQRGPSRGPGRGAQPGAQPQGGPGAPPPGPGGPQGQLQYGPGPDAGKDAGPSELGAIE